MSLPEVLYNFAFIDQSNFLFSEPVTRGFSWTISGLLQGPGAPRVALHQKVALNQNEPFVEAHCHRVAKISATAPQPSSI